MGQKNQKKIRRSHEERVSIKKRDWFWQTVLCIIQEYFFTCLSELEIREYHGTLFRESYSCMES